MSDGRGHAESIFASSRAASRSWYAAARSRALRRGRLHAFDLGDRRIAVYRDRDGCVHALDARCPHLGADLTLGTVERGGLRCAFHGWCFGPDGVCRGAPGHGTPPGRRTRAYPCQERWGIVWVFNAAAPLFDLPSPEGGRWWPLVLPPQRIRCHPHLVLANGLDISHYETLHGMTFSEAPRLSVGSCEVSVTMQGRPRSRFWRFLSGTRRRDIVAQFTTIGGSLAWTSVYAPVRFHVLFSGRPDRSGGCVTRTVFLFPRGTGWNPLRALGLMAMLLHDDRRVLDTIDFRPDFSAADEPLRAFARVVDELGAW
ncbi:MAG TPA: Rieske 2Fe-2S domain-containing protein [Vicinamibacterales bacterium]|nr:Rieske 2Fe-2S domain-containing protein [Vicinamibacterales bacterium]